VVVRRPRLRQEFYVHDPTSASRTRYRIGAAASLVLALFIGFMTFAPAASAHHPEISASTACDTGGDGFLVSFDSISWQTSGGNGGGGANPHIDIAYRLRTDGGSASAWTTLTWKSSYRYTEGNNYRFSDSFGISDLSQGNQIQLRATASANWGNGTGGGQTNETAWQSLPTNCQPPGSPTVGSSVACTNGNGDITITLANTAVAGAKSVTFVVTDPRTNTTTTKTLSPGQSDTVVLTGFPDGPVTIPVTADTIHHDQTLTVTCDRPGIPSVSAQIACANGNGDITVTLTNTGGDLPVTFVVTDPRTNETTTKTLSPGQSDTVVLTGFPDGPVTIPITANQVAYDQTVTVACDRPGVPSVTAANACVNGDGDITITLANTGGDLPVTFVVTDPRTDETTTKTLSPGQSDTVVLTGFPDGPVTIPVTTDGKKADQTLTVACDIPGTPQVSAGSVCVSGDGNVSITLANTAGNQPIVFVVTDPRTGATTTRTVAPAGSTTVTLSGFPDGPVTIPVTADGVPSDQTLTIACDVPGVPSVSTDPHCVNFDGDVLVTLANVGGTEPIVFVVTDPRDGSTTTRTVAVGASATVTLAGFPDGTYTIGITADGKVLDAVATIDCDRPGTPAVFHDVECAALGGTVLVTVANSSPAGEAEPITFAVTDPRDPSIVTMLTLAPGESGVVSIDSLPDGSHTIPVSADGVVLTPIVVTIDCQQPKVDAISLTCSTVGQTVELSNTGGTDATVSVLKDDVLVTDVVVPANGSAEAVVPMAEDETATITVLDGETELESRTVTQDCEDEVTTTTTTPEPTTTAAPTSTVPGETTVPAQVLSETVTKDPVVQSGTLPVTGSSPFGLALFGAALVAFGVCAVQAQRRRG
jgi:molybdopterin-guanine dinucleotide biosynthesis protein A